MESRDPIDGLVTFLGTIKGGRDKAFIASKVMQRFNLRKDRSVYSCDEFAVRFSVSETNSFGNTVLSLSTLQKYDHLPFIVILLTRQSIECLLANSTCLKKISHSSQQLRENNIKGSFNGTDILRVVAGCENNIHNLREIFTIHESVGFDGNLPRLVEATNNIAPSGKRFEMEESQLSFLLAAPQRAKNFSQSDHFTELKNELDGRVVALKNEILIAALIENVNIRGRVIEYLIAGEDESLRQGIIKSLRKTDFRIPAFKTENTLGDFSKEFPEYVTATDVKTKVMILDSNPKAYNIDKMLEFLSREKSVFLFYFVGIEPMKIVSTALLSMFQDDLRESTILLKHWAGRASRGVTQFNGKTIEKLILGPSSEIDIPASELFLKSLVDIL